MRAFLTVCFLLPFSMMQAGAQTHDADTSLNGRIELGELLRVIQFYNFSDLHCDVATEDGFAPGTGDTACPPHDSDYFPQDWRIALSELLRVIQFYNAGGYNACEDGEDGFCPEFYFSINYVATSGGTVLGQSAQSVAAGSDGSIVTAVPSNGYFFYGWSDEVRDASRQETTVAADIELMARFEPIPESILLPGGSTLEFVAIPSGTFEMGSPPEERSRYIDENPVHQVTFVSSFDLGLYEVTQGQWLALMDAWPNSPPSESAGLGEDRPAYNVTWRDVADFLDTLNDHIYATRQGPSVRLPSEAEWEYAARAGTHTRFYWGDSLSVGDGCEDDGERSARMWYCGSWWETMGPAARPVGMKPANPFGLFDMNGNISEWCEDEYMPDYIGATVDGTAREATGRGERVVRGGCWDSDVPNCRSARRNKFIENQFSNCIGFRLAR